MTVSTIETGKSDGPKSLSSDGVTTNLLIRGVSTRRRYGFSEAQLIVAVISSYLAKCAGLLSFPFGKFQSNRRHVPCGMQNEYSVIA